MTSFHHHASFPIAASPARTYRALVEPAELSRWFAEHADVDARPGGAFRFRGRGALGGDTAQTIVALEPERSLAFRWTIHDVATEVRWTLVPDGDGSKLEIDHDVRGALPFRNARHAIDDLWRLHVGNLMAHLAGQDNVVLADFGAASPEVRVSIEIAARPAKVFRALLDPALMNRWLGGAAKVDVATGAYSYGWSYECEGRQVAGGPTRIVELVENQRLVTDWPDWRGDPEAPTTRVTWQLDALDGGARTRVTIIHAGFAHTVDRSDYQQGWGQFAEQLKNVVEDTAAV